MNVFCKHNWEILSETTTKSRIELLREVGCQSIKGMDNPADRKFIQVVACKKCGTLKRFVEDI